MPKNLVDVSTFTDPIVVPVDGDVRNAASVEVSFQGLANRTRHTHNRFDAQGRVILPSGMVNDVYFGLPDAISLGGWNTSDPFEWISTAQNATMLWDIRNRFSPLATLQQIGVLVDPGAARAPGGSYTIGDQMEVTLKKSVHVFTVGTPSRVVSTHQSTQDNGTSALQWVWFNVTGSPAVGSAQSWQVQVKASAADADTLPDKVYGLYVKISSSRLDTV